MWTLWEIKGTSLEHANIARTWEQDMGILFKKYCTYNWCSTLAFVLAQSPFATHPPKQLFHVQIKLQVIFVNNLNITYEFSMAESKTKGLMPISFCSDYMRGLDELVCTIMPFMLPWYGMLWTRDFHHPSSHLPPMVHHLKNTRSVTLWLGFSLVDRTNDISFESNHHTHNNSWGVFQSTMYMGLP